MDKETWSIVLSVVGLLLGLLSAEAQLRSMARWALMASGEKARAWVKRMDDDANLFASNTSALVAFIAGQILSIILMLFLVIALLGVLKGETVAAPLWIRQAIMLISALWVGNKLAGVSNLVDMTLRKTRASIEKKTSNSCQAEADSPLGSIQELGVQERPSCTNSIRSMRRTIFCCAPTSVEKTLVNLVTT